MHTYIGKAASINNVDIKGLKNFKCWPTFRDYHRGLLIFTTRIGPHWSARGRGGHISPEKDQHGLWMQPK